MSTSVLRRGKAISRFGLQRYDPAVRVVRPRGGAAHDHDEALQVLLLVNPGIVGGPAPLRSA